MVERLHQGHAQHDVQEHCAVANSNRGLRVLQRIKRRDHDLQPAKAHSPNAECRRAVIVPRAPLLTLDGGFSILL